MLNGPAFKWIIVCLLSALCAFLASRLDIRQNVQDMLPDSISKGELRLLSRLGLINRVFITVEGPDFNTVSESVVRLGRELAQNPLFTTVIYRIPGAMRPDMVEQFMAMLPAIMDEHDLSELNQALGSDSIRKALQEDFLLLNSPAGPGLKGHMQHDPLGLIRFFLKKLESLKSGSRMKVRDGLFCTPDGRACMLWAETAGVLTDSSTAEKVQRALNSAVSKMLLPGTSVTVVGTLPHTLANARMVNKDLKLLLTLATVAVILLFWFFTRDLRSLALVLIPLLSAPFAILAAGAVSNWNVSGIALAFGVVLIGIAVDFSVHIYMFIRSTHAGKEQSSIVGTPVFRSIIMAYLTTAGVFVVLLFSQIPAHRQMAVMAIAGLSAALLLAFLLVPDMVRKARTPARQENAFLLYSPEGVVCVPLLMIWLVIMVAGVISWSRISYNGDIREFDVKTRDITRAEHHFHTLWGTDPNQIMVVAVGRDLNHALDLNDDVSQWLRQHGIDDARSVSGLLPGPHRQEQNIRRWQEFWAQRLPEFKKELAIAAGETGFSSDAFAPFLSWLIRPPEKVDPAGFLNSPVGAMLSGMIRFNPAEKVPDTACDRDEKVMVITLVPGKDTDMAMLRHICSALPGVHIFSGSGWKAEMEDMMRSDIRRMSLGALLLVTCIAWFFFRNIRMVAAAMVPVVSALAVMAIFTVLSGGEFNMMHLLMGIMVTGLSIDYGIFMVCAVRDRHTASTVRAVALCALSTISGFGILALAHHPVLKSLGETVLAGIGASLPAALLITPCLLRVGKGKRGGN